MRFSDLLDAVRSQPLELSIPAEWAQGRASFGGLVAALQYEAMRAKVPADRPVRSLAITFVGPVEPEVPVSFEVDVLREGKAVSQVLGRAMQKGQVVTLIQGSFGASRPSEVAVTAPAGTRDEALGRLPGTALHQGRDPGIHAASGDALERRRPAVHRQ